MPGGPNTIGYGSRNRNYTLSVGGSSNDVLNRQYAAGWYGGGGAAAGGSGNSSSDALAARRIAEAGGTIGGITYPSGGYGGGGYGSVPGFIQDYQNKFDQANAKNESRYGEILGDYRSLYDRQMGSLGQGNAQAIADLNTNYDRQRSSSYQDMINRGLGNSTIKQTMDQGIERQRAAAINRENFNYENARRAADAGLTTDRLNFMERRTDKAPDIGQLIALSQAYGASGAGGGGGSPYGYSGNGAGNYGSVQGTGFEALAQLGGGLNTLGNYGAMPSFSGFSHQPAVAATSARQGANTQAVYGYANQNPGYNFNSGYSNPYQGMTNYQLNQSVLGSMPDYSHYA